MKKLNIAMTASIGVEYQSIWGSGITQNILWLYQLFSQSPIVGQVFLLDLLQSDDAPIKEIKVANNFYKCINKPYAIEHVDILIEIGTQVWTDLGKSMKEKGAKIVSMRCGNTYVDEVMGIFFDKTSITPINHIIYDEIWVLPHHEESSASMLQTLYRCPVKTANYIWESEFIHLAAGNLNTEYSYKSNPNKINKTIAICEPNLSPIKTFHLPLLVCEEAYRQQPQYIKHIYTMNTWRFNQNQSLLHFVNRLDIFKQGICSFESRVDIVTTMTQTADIVVSHQWQNALNNLYFDVLYGGYALVHNSHFLRDYGYYYQNFNAQDGAKKLIEALKNHDTNLEQYKQNNHSLFTDYSINNIKNIDAYTNLLNEVYNKEVACESFFN